jgi:FixJ family two-component response regulator
MVYVIDDDESIRKALEMLLQSANMNVQAFESGEQFLDFNPRKEMSCIVTDLKMKGLDGISICKNLQEKGVDIPIIFLTAFDSAEYRLQASQCGAAGYLSKPVDDKALTDTIYWAICNK